MRVYMPTSKTLPENRSVDRPLLSRLQVGRLETTLAKKNFEEEASMFSTQMARVWSNPPRHDRPPMLVSV